MFGEPSMCLASMGIYVFRTEFLFEHLCRDANKPGSHRDFGRDIIPSIIKDHLVRAWSFCDPSTGSPAYWKDVGTLESYYEANMDLISVHPQCNLYDPDMPWPGFLLGQTPASIWYWCADQVSYFALFVLLIECSKTVHC